MVLKYIDMENYGLDKKRLCLDVVIFRNCSFRVYSHVKLWFRKKRSKTATVLAIVGYARKRGEKRERENERYEGPLILALPFFL